MKYKTRPRTAYLAARYHRRFELAECIPEIEAANIKVNARWIKAEQTETDEDRRKWALLDYEDVANADFLIFFADDADLDSSVDASGEDVVPASWISGGRHVEFGLALALGMDIAVIGKPQNIFHWYADRQDRIMHFDDLAEFIDWYIVHNVMPDDAE